MAGPRAQGEVARAGRDPARAPGRARRRATSVLGDQIVVAVLEAGALLLERDGLSGLTTNAIARVAGVSIGSVYAYFPDKHAIVVELARRLERRGLALYTEHFARLASAELGEAIPLLVDLLRSPALGSYATRRVLVTEVPRQWSLSVSATTDATVGAAIEAFLSARPEQVREGPRDRMAFVVQHAVEGVVEAAVLHDHTLLADAAFGRELDRLVWRYLARDPSRDLERPWALYQPEVAATLDTAPSDAGVAERFEAARRHEPLRGRARPRPLPTNARGRAGVEKIVEATSRILCRDGFEGLGIRAIAREAGITPGAVYRHFPDVESAVAEVARRVEKGMIDGLALRLASPEATSARDVCAAAIELVATEQLGDLNLRRALRAQVPSGWLREDIAAKHATMATLVGAALARWPGQIRRDDPRLLGFVLAHAVDAVAQAAVLRRREWIDGRVLVDELTTLAWQYVRADP